MSPDLSRTDSVYQLPMPGGHGTGDINCGSLLLNLVSNHVLMGVMVDLAAHCFPRATILSEGGVTYGLASPFLMILGPSSCSSSATVWVSYEADLGGLAFLLL